MEKVPGGCLTNSVQIVTPFWGEIPPSTDKTRFVVGGKTWCILSENVVELCTEAEKDKEAMKNVVDDEITIHGKAEPSCLAIRSAGGCQARENGICEIMDSLYPCHGALPDGSR
jgi:hypothetical protein